MNRKMIGIAAVGAAGVYVLWRARGRKRIRTLPYGYGIKLKKAITIDKPADQIYACWRNLENLPALFDNLLSVKRIDERKSHWTLRVPGRARLEWDAEITIDRPNEMIGWRSLDGADLDNAGSIRFERATGGRGTVVRVALQYNPPAGRLGAALATLMGEKPASQVQEALRKLKQLMETGEIPTVARDRKFPAAQIVEPVEIASEDSFPASDAPAWTGTTGPIG